MTVLIDTPFSESLDARLGERRKSFRYATEPLGDGTSSWVYVCAMGGLPPHVLPCSITRTAGLQQLTRSRTAGQAPAALSAIVADPDAVVTVVRRIVVDESVVEPA